MRRLPKQKTEKEQLEVALNTFSLYASGVIKCRLKGHGIRWFRRAVKDVQERLKQLETK